MSSLMGQNQKRMRDNNKGAILLVVLLVMVVLIGVGMSGLFLTKVGSGLSSNLIMRNEALVVAEAGVERARQILNYISSTDPNWIPSVEALLQGNHPSDGDEIPSNPDECSGLAPTGGAAGVRQKRGALLVDTETHGCTPGSPCTLRNVPYPQLVNFRESIPDLGPSIKPNLGHYTVFIRQDQADCRMSNFTCDYPPAPLMPDGGGAIPSDAAYACTPPFGTPTPNGILVIHSEGVASDKVTKVVLEVTLAPSQSLAVQTNATLSALCASGANGCEDNSGVNNGITVNSPINYGGSPSPGGTSGAGGAISSGGTSGTAGSPSTGGVPGSGGESSTGGSGSGGTGAGGSTACQYNKCLTIATMGIMGPWDILWSGMSWTPPKAFQGTVVTPGDLLFSQWLAAHASQCAIQNIDITTTRLDAMDPVTGKSILAPLKTIIALDLHHTPADKANWIINQGPNTGTRLPYTGTQRILDQSEVDAVLNWIDAGGGLVTTTGYLNAAAEVTNVNKFLRPYGVTYSTQTSSTAALNLVKILKTTDITAFRTTAPIASVLTQNITRLRVSFAIDIKRWVSNAEAALPAESANFTTFISRKWDTSNGGDGTTIYNVGVGFIARPGVATSGRVVVLGDEWITYDSVWSDTTLQANTFWNNVLTWLTATCTP